MTETVRDAMSAAERRAGVGLASIFALRMLGLFLILPVFAVHAQDIPGGDSYILVGLAIGAYGITQACLQILFGVMSDRFGRKPVIVFGLLLFALGSAVAALGENIHVIIAGRILQGAGAISAAVTALAADLTREHHRTKVMAMIGASIGVVFAGSLVLAPILYAAIGMSGIFWLTGGLALAAIYVVLQVVPNAPPLPRGPQVRIRDILADTQLMRLNFGVFALHLMQTAMWVMVPLALVQAGGGGLPIAEHWKVYLPAVLFSFAVMVPAVIHAERKGRLKAVFLAAVGLLLVVQMGFLLFSEGLWWLGFWLTLFFVAFNVLEATQPSWISRIAPPHAKGMALGVYNTLQSLGLFAGGALGGVLIHFFGASAVLVFCAGLSLLWLYLTLGLNPPAVRKPVAARADS